MKPKIDGTPDPSLHCPDDYEAAENYHDEDGEHSVYEAQVAANGNEGFDGEDGFPLCCACGCERSEHLAAAAAVKLRPLFVGESNPYGPDEHFALFPAPDGSAGHRLCTLVLGLSRKDYLSRFDRLNLCDGKWSVARARERVAELLGVERRAIVALGAKVASAFGVAFEPFTSREIPNPSGACHLVVLPHPSGLSRGWDAPGSFERARELLRSAGVLPALEERRRS